jgi:hypothetical protein
VVAGVTTLEKRLASAASRVTNVYTHTCLNHHRISLHANRVASETETIIDEVLNFPTLGILRDE